MKGRSRFWERLVKLSTLKIVLIYLVLGALWIIFSDLLVFQTSHNPPIYTLLSIAKGWLYVVVTSLLLYWLIDRYFTERKHIEKSLEDEKAQAELYLDVMGHDITNLNQIGIGYLELAMGTLNPRGEGLELLLKPLQALRNSSRLIDNVHKLRRARNEGPALQKVNVARVLRNLIPAYSDYSGRDIRVDYTGRDCHVMANDLLADVFSNIVENSIRASAGLLHISIRLTGACTEGKEYCLVSIEDDGPGIPDTLKKALFIRPLGVARTSGGVLGLHLAWMLVNQYGGQIWVDDRIPGDYKKGSRFVVILPAVE